MAKLFLTQLPTEAELEQNRLKYNPEIDAISMRSHLLLRKLATDLETNLDAFLSRFNLSPGRFTLLAILRGYENGLMPSELAQFVGVTQATISGLINSLEKAGLVERKGHQKDGRAFVIHLTQKGHDLTKEIGPLYYSRLQTFWSQFSHPEKTQLNQMMEKMIGSIHALSEK